MLLQRLFRRWPADRLVVYGPSLPSGAAKLSCVYRCFRPAAARIQYSRLAPFAPVVGQIVPCARPIELLPEGSIVVAVMQSSAYYRVAADVARRNGAPLVLIIHDDPEEIEPVRWWSRPLLRAFNTRVYREARLRFCISPQMAKELEARYGARADVLYPNRSQNITPRPVDTNRRLRRPGQLVLGYAGALGYGYGHRIEELLPLFREQKVVIRIYGFTKPWFADAAEVEYAGSAKDSDELWPRVQAECDAVILPYAYRHNGHEALYRTHFPSKLTEYLALGMPVIITGPDYATGVQWGKANPRACALLNSKSSDGGAGILARVREDGGYRATLASGALIAAHGEFDPGRIESDFLARLRAL